MPCGNDGRGLFHTTMTASSCIHLRLSRPDLCCDPPTS